MVCTATCCGLCCSIFSLVCLLFLGGLASNIKTSGKRLYLDEKEFDPALEAVKQAIYGYITCLVLSAGLYAYGSQMTRSKTRAGPTSLAEPLMQDQNLNL